MSAFNPLGFLAAVEFTFMDLLQDILRSEADWGDHFPPIFTTRFKFLQDSFHLLDLFIARCCLSLQEHSFSPQRHVFAEPSELGYGSIVYIYRQFSNAVEVFIVMAISRVSPLKFVIYIHSASLTLCCCSSDNVSYSCMSCASIGNRSGDFLVWLLHRTFAG